MATPTVVQKFVCYLSFEIGTIVGTAKTLFHNNEIVKLSFNDVIQAQQVLPDLGSKARLISIASWEAQGKCTLDALQKKLEFNGAKRYVIECLSDGTKVLV